MATPLIHRGPPIHANLFTCQDLMDGAVQLTPGGAPVGHVPPGAAFIPQIIQRIQRATGTPGVWLGSIVQNNVIAAADRSLLLPAPVPPLPHIPLYQGILLDVNGVGYKIRVFDVSGAIYAGGAAAAPAQTYVVVVSEIGASCSCPDCQINGNTCKHIFFVLHYQFGIPVAALTNAAAIRAFLSAEFATMG